MLKWCGHLPISGLEKMQRQDRCRKKYRLREWKNGQEIHVLSIHDGEQFPQVIQPEIWFRVHGFGANAVGD